MEGFSYVDIFDTKGIEYLIVIAFLVLIIPAWIVINKPVQAKAVILKSIHGLSANLLKIPKGLFYSKNHTWTFMEKSGTAKVGVDDLLLHITGGVSVDYLRSEGEKIEKGEVLANIFSGARKLQIKSPISGEIEKVNSKLDHNEGIINSDPYGAGWLSKIKPVNWKEETNEFMIEDEAVDWTKEELLKCKDFISGSVQVEADGVGQVVLQAGGELTDFPLSEMPADVWDKFQEEFLD